MHGGGGGGVRVLRQGASLQKNMNPMGEDLEKQRLNTQTRQQLGGTLGKEGQDWRGCWRRGMLDMLHPLHSPAEDEPEHTGNLNKDTEGTSSSFALNLGAIPHLLCVGAGPRINKPKPHSSWQ